VITASAEDEAWADMCCVSKTQLPSSTVTFLVAVDLLKVWR